MRQASVVPAEEAPRRGRNPKVDRGEIVISNGLYARQWEWIQQEAANKTPPLDAAQYQRFMIDMVINAVEASRAGSVATPKDDKKFERLVSNKNKKSKTNKN